MTALSVLLSVFALVAPLSQTATANHPSGSFLDCEPETDINRLASNHTVTCTLEDLGGTPVNVNDTAVRVHGEIDCITNCAGATYSGNLTNGEAGNDGNDAPGNGDDVRTAPDGQCLIQQGQNSCTFTYSRGGTAGQDELIFWIDHNIDTATDESDPTETQGGAGTDGEPDDTDVLTKDWQASQAQTLDCTPDSATNPATDNPNQAGNETSETYTCTVLDQFGVAPADQGTYEIDIEETDDGDGAAAPVDFDNCGNGTNVAGNRNNNVCTFTVTSTANNADTRTFCAFIDQNGNDTDVEGDCGEAVTPDDNDATDVFQKTYTQRQPTTLDCEPDDATNPPGDNQHTITCQITDQFGNNVAGNQGGVNNVQVDGEMLAGSSNDADGTTAPPDFSQQTDNNGLATFVYNNNPPNQTTQRQDTICFWIDNDNDNELDGDCAELQGANDNDATDVVRKTWSPTQAQNQNAAQTIDAEPEAETNNMAAGDNTHTISVVARDLAGNATAGQTTTPPGNQPGSTTRVRADIISGPNAITQTQAEINCTADMNTNAITGATPSATNRTHRCDYNQNIDGQNNEVGTDQIVVFYDLNDNGIYDGANCGTAQQTGEPCDQVAKTWVSGAQNLTLTPDAATTAAGVCQQFTVNVTQNVSGTNQPVPNQTVDVLAVFQNPPAAGQPNQPNVEFCNPGATAGPNVLVPPNNQQTPQGNLGSGPAGGGAPNQRHAEFTTDQNGQFTFGIQSSQPGTINVTAFIDANNNNTPDDAVQDTSTLTVTQGGTAGARAIEATPTTATNPIGTTHTINVTVRGAATGGQPGPVLAGVPVNAQVTGTQNGGNPNTTLNCGTTDNQGRTTCTYQGVNQGTDTITVWVNQGPQNNQPATAGPDPGEPQTTVTKTWTARQAGFSLDVTCTGQGLNDDRDVGENDSPNNNAVNNVEANNATADCRNPLSSTSVTFTANVIQADSGDAGSDPDPASGVRVDWTINVQPNNATTADVAFGAGSVSAGPNTVQCTTDASGSCSITVNNPTPTNGDQVRATGTIAGQLVPLADISPTQGGAQGGVSSDTATKEWQTAQASNIILTPGAATNQIGQNHTVTATVTNQFGQGVTSNGTVDFRVINGPNTGRQALDVPLSANGTATFTYSSNVAGDDTIQACLEIPGQGEDDNCTNQEFSNTAFKRWQTAAVAATAVGLDMDADDPNVNGCELTSATDPNRETSATNSINPSQATAPGNFHRVCAAAFQTGENVSTQGRIPGASITFTTTGPGRIYAPTAGGGCNVGTVPSGPAQTTVTVTADQNGIAFACLFSQQAGNQTVTASSGTPAQTAQGTKTWTVGAERARNIQLCHGDITGTTCAGGSQTNEPGDEHQFTARVTDAQGNQVAGVPVEFRETGPAIFTPQGGSTATVTTDANGLVNVLIVSDVEGTSTVVAEIRSGGGVPPVGGGAPPRGGGANDDECEQGAGTNNQPPAGNCISQTLTKVWDDAPEPPAACDDGDDNDGDGFIDEEDPGCTDPTDDSEEPFNPTDPEKIRHDRRISIRFQDGTGARNNGLVVFGRLRAPDGFNDCISQQAINIQRRINGRWITKKTTNTNRRGRYAVEIFDQASNYRAVAVRSEILDEDLNQLHICKKAVKAKRHRHRR